MKIIISHDVDHLYASDHIFRDFVLEKLWIRSFIELCRRKISISVFFSRLDFLFHNRMHRIDELMEFDSLYGVPSTFFIGMANGLGMSYAAKSTIPVIERIQNHGFNVGVHGIDYQNYESMKTEHDLFKKISGMECFGIRNHYVRFDDHTFIKMDKAGYLFDSTWFNKEKTDIRPPYKVGRMWEFPLHIMEGYLLKNRTMEEGIGDVQSVIEKAEADGMPYCIILFHDFYFNKSCFPLEYHWYKWLIKYLVRKNYEFISYEDAVKELENRYVNES